MGVNFTRVQVVRTARKILKRWGLRSVCVDVLKSRSEFTPAEYLEFVKLVVEDTLYWEN